MFALHAFIIRFFGAGVESGSKEGGGGEFCQLLPGVYSKFTAWFHVCSESLPPPTPSMVATQISIFNFILCYLYDFLNKSRGVSKNLRIGLKFLDFHRLLQVK